MRPAAAAAALLVAAAGCGSLGQKTYSIPSSAMEPTLQCGVPKPGCSGDGDDKVFAEPVEQAEIRRGDIVVFQTPPLAEARCGVGGIFVKRVVGMPGERLEVRKIDGLNAVYVDGQELDEPYLEQSRRDSADPETLVVPAGKYFVMGDNRSQSCDSREWGALPGANITHRVTAAERPSGRVEFR